MCDCFHLAFPNWHAASGTGVELTTAAGAGRRLRAPEPGTEDDSICDEPSQFTEGERPRPQGSSPVEEYPETEKYTDSDKECEAEHDPHYKSGSGKKTKKSGLGSMFEKRSTPKMSKLKEVHSPESGLIVKTAKDGCSEGLVYGGGGKEGIFIKEVVPESPASKSLKLKEGDQILSATVYFDNVSYEDAIQILEHAQAYKVKLCLKRKPDIIETEPAIESDVIPEDDLYAPEMREQGKTKRRGDARISWPKFPSFGKGRKSRFARSHSSSEADEQRKLELSPTTSDTESPIKSQDALKGKKQKIKQSVFKRRGRISSSEDQDTDVSGQISGNILQTHEASDMLSPECLQSPSGETPEVYVTEDPKIVDDLMLEQNDQKLTETVQHKAELITIGSTLKTEDLTVALADEKSPSGLKSPDGKKKKKERSEFKMKILGKDKLHKKDAKAKSSPKRLKTLGASMEIADQPENEKSDVQGGQLALDANTQIISSESSRVISAKSVMEMSIPKVELDISDVALIEKSPQKGEEKTKKGKDIKQKQETKTSPAFKLPKIGFSDIATEETIQKINLNVEERQAKIEQLTTQGSEVKEDPYERLSKRSLSRTKLPKREDIEIPGMEDMSMRTTAKIIKDPKAVSTGHYEQIQAETVQMSIDVDSVKEAVSKLPGFKLPKVDTSGVPIPEEITVIDANAQRISVKTPTKVLDTKTKHEAHFPKFDITASPEISKTTVKLPKITPADLTSEALLIETKVDLKTPEKKYKTKAKQSDKIKTEVYKREHIIIPGKESAQEAAILQRKEMKTSVTETLKGKGQTEGVIADVKIPEIDSIEYIDSVGGSPAKNDGGIRLTSFGVNLDAAKPQADISFPEIRGEVKHVEAKKQTFKLPKLEALTAGNRVNVLEADMDINIDVAEIKTLEREGKGSKFKMPNLGISMPKVKGHVTQPEAKAEVRLPEVPEVEIGNVSVPEQKLADERHELEVKPLQTEHELDGQESKLKMPKLGIAMPKVKGPEVDLSFSKKDGDVAEAKAYTQIPEDSNISFDMKQPESGAQIDVQGSKFKMPKFGMTMPKVTGPEIEKISLSKKDKDVTLPEAKAEVKFPQEVLAVDIRAPSADTEEPLMDMKTTGTEHEGKGSKFKMPHLGFSMPKVKGPQIDISVSKKDADVTLPESNTEVKLPEAPEVNVSLAKADVSLPEDKVEVKKPEIDIKPLHTEVELEQGSKFKMPKFGMTMPKVTGPEIDFSLSKKDKDVTLPEAKTEVKLPDVKLKEPSAHVEIKAPEIKVATEDTEGSPSKFKMPTFKLPKFGVGTPSSSIEMPDTDKDVKIDGVDIKFPEEVLAVDIRAPSVDTEEPLIDMKTTGTEHEGKGSKFKMPHLGFSMPKVKGPQIDISVSKKDADVTLPESNTEVKLPEAPEVNVSLAKADVSLPEDKVEVKKPEIDIKPLHTEVELEQGSKFKMPKLGMSMPKVKGPDINFGLSKKDGDGTLPEAKAEGKVPEVELKEPSVVEIKAGETKVAAKGREASPSKFKMPTFKVPKFGVGTPNVSVEVPDLDKDVKIDGTDGSVVNIAAPSIDIEGPLIDMKTTETEQDGRGSKFKMPHLGFSMSKVKGPKIDLGLSKKDVDVTLPEAKADVKLPEVDFGKADVSIPEAEMEIKKPELEMQSFQTKGELDGQGEKFKVPKFGIKMPKVKGPEIDLSLSKKNDDVTLPQTKVEVRLPDAPKIDVSLGKAKVMIPEEKAKVKKPELATKPLQSDVELEGQGGKFTMPKFGIKMPKVQGPEIDLSLSKKDVDVTLPESKAEVKLPEAPDSDFNLGKVDISVPEAKMEVKKHELEMKSQQFEGELDGQGSKFKIPKFGISMPKLKGPEIDLSLSKTDVDVRLPEVKAKVNIPDVELKEPSAKVEIKAPEIDAQLSNVKESPSKYKLPTFKFPKFGLATPIVSAEVPVTDKEIKLDGADMHISMPHTDVDVPEVTAEVHLPEVKVKEPSGGVGIERQPGVEVDAKLKKPRFSMPKFSFSKPSVQAPGVDVSLKDVNVAVSEGNIDVKGEAVDMKAPECEAEIDGQGSKFKTPKFGITMPKVKGPEFDLNFSKKDGDVTLPDVKAEAELPQTPKIAVDMKPPECETEIDAQGRKFKMTKFGITRPEFDLSLSKKDADVTLPEAKAKVKLPDTDLKEPSAQVEIKAPDIKIEGKDTEGSPSKFKMPTFKLPKFGIGTPSATIEVPDTNSDVKIDGADIKIPEEILTVDIAAPSIDTEGPSIHMKTTGTEHEGKGSKFKMPKFGMTMPKVTGPEIDLSLSKKDEDLTLPKAKAEVKLPDVEMKERSAEVEIKAPEIKVATKDTEGSPSKFKMPTFKLPKFGIGTPSATTEADIKIPEEVLAVDITAPSIGTEGPSIEMKTTGTPQEGKGSKFKMPSLGFSVPQVKGPDFDLSVSKKDVDVTLPEAKAKGKLPDIKLKEPSAHVEIKAPEIEAQTDNFEGSPSKIKMPTFKLPKLGATTPKVSVEVPDVDKDINIDGAKLEVPKVGATVDVTAPSIDTKGLSVDVKVKGSELEGSGSKFKMPKFGISMPKVKGPEINLSLSQKDVDVTLPEAKAEVQLPDVEVKEPEGAISVPDAPTVDAEAKMKRPNWTFPKFSFSRTGGKAPEVDVNLETPTVDVTSPEAKAEVCLPDVEVQGPSGAISMEEPPAAELDANLKKTRFSLPRISFSKSGVKEPDVSAKLPHVDVSLPEVNVEVKRPEVELKPLEGDAELEGQESKFKMPKFGISMPKVKGPELDLSLSKKDVDVTLPEAKAEVQLPDVKLKQASAKVEIKAPEIEAQTDNVEGSPSKFKMPTFKLPKFGGGTPSATAEVHKDVKINGADIKIPEEVLAVDITAPSIDTEGPSIHMKTTGTEHEGKGSKFKMPKFGMTMPKVTGPEIDLSLSKKDVDLTLPEAKAEVKLPDVEMKEHSAEVEIKAPEIKVATKDTEGSPSKFKMPTFKLPKFGIGTPSATAEVHKDVKIDGADIKIPEEVLAVDITAPSIGTEGPSIEMKTTGTPQEGKGSKFKMPSLGFSVPQVKGPDFDLSVSKKDVDVTLPEAKAKGKLPDVKLKEPSAHVEIKAPDMKVATEDTEGSPSKFKMPTFKLPKFGVSTPSATMEVPNEDKDVKIDGADIKIPEEVLAVDITAPSIDTEGPSIHMKTSGTEHEGKGSKFKMPKFGMTMPKVTGPEIDLSLSKKDVDLTLPKAKAEVKLPDVEMKEHSAEVEIKAPEIKVATKDTEGSPSKFKMPTFKLPKFGIGTPSATAGADIKIPEEVLAVDITAPSIGTEGPSIEMKTTGTPQEGKGSKFKMPSLGFSVPQVKGPDFDLSVSKKDVDVTLPEAKAKGKLPDIKLKEPSAHVEIKAPEIEAQTDNFEGSPSKIKMPKFTLPKLGATTPKVSVEVPDVDKDINIDGAKLEVPKEGATVDVTAPSIDTKGLSVDVKVKGSELEGSGSKFKMPKFGISMPKVKGPEIDLSLSQKDVDVTLPEAKAEVQLPDVEVKEPEGAISVPDAPTVDAEAKMKRPNWTFPKFSFSRTGGKAPEVDVNLETPTVDVTSPEAKAEVCLPDVEVQGPSGAISVEEPPAAELDANLKKTRFSLPRISFSKSSVKEPEVSAKLPHVDVSLPEVNVEVKRPEVELKPLEGDAELEGSGSKFKMPKFGISMPKVKGPEIDLSLSQKDVDVTLPEAKAEVQIPDVKLKQASAKVEIKAPEIEAQTDNVEGSPSKFKMPTFKLPKFGGSTPKVTVEVPDVDKDIKIDEAKLEVCKEGATVDVTAPSIDTEGLSVDVKVKGSGLEGSGSKFKMPKFGISMPKVKGPEIDLSLSQKDVDVTLPEAKAEVQLPDVKLKQASAKVEIKAPEIEAQTDNVEGSPSKLKMPTFTLPKLGAATPKVSVEVPDVDKDTGIDVAKLGITKEGATVDVTAPSIDNEGLSVDVKATAIKLEGSGSKFKMPKFGISMPKVKGPEINLSLSQKDVDVTLPEAKAEVQLPDVEVKEPEGAISVPDAPTVDAEAKMKRPNWTFPKFSFSRTGGKAPEVDVNLETPTVDVTSPEAKAEVCLPDVEVQGPSVAISMEEPPAAELDANLKKTRFSLPRISFSKSSVKEPEVGAKLPHVDVSLPEGEVKVKQPEMAIEAPQLEADGHDGQGSKFKLSKFGIAKAKAKGREEDLNASEKDVDFTLPKLKADVKLPETESSASVEIKATKTESKSKDVGGSPLKSKMPIVKMPKFGGATYDVTVEAPDADKVVETNKAKDKEDVTVNIKGLDVDIKTDVCKAAITDSETKPETDSVGLGSPSKFKLPSFKMPKLSFSRPKPEDEHVPVETECKADQLEMEVEPKGEIKSPIMTLTSFGEILKNVDVEFDVPKVDEKDLETDEPSGKQLEKKEKETNSKQDTVKSPERTGWFKFPKFGLSSPSEPAKISEKEEHKDKKSSAGETVDEEISPTCSVQSSDAFADISSAMTSEHVGLSLSSPTKVTVKYSDPNTATGFGEMHSNIITSTTRTELISVEPNLPEKITIPSSGVSSSSEDTLRLESGKIHVITSNIQATPEAQHAKLLTAVQVQPAGGLPLKSEAHETTSWTVEDSQSGTRTVYERHLVRETSSETSESKGRIVITKQITHMFDSSVPGETASSIQRLKDSVHSEKMRFFDGAEK